MKRFSLHSIGVSSRLWLLVFLSIFALLAVGFGGWLGISNVSRSVVSLQEERLPSAMLLGEMRSTTLLLVEFSFEVLMREKQENIKPKIEATLGRKKLFSDALEKSMSKYEMLHKSAAEQEAWAKFKESILPWKARNEELSAILKDIARNDDFEKQSLLFTRYKAPLTSWGYVQATVDRDLASLLALNKADVERSRVSDARTLELAMRFMFITLGLAVVVLLVLAVIFVRSITAPLERLRQKIVSAANSNNEFAERTGARGKNEIAQTEEAFNYLLKDVQVTLRDRIASARHKNKLDEPHS